MPHVLMMMVAMSLIIYCLSFSALVSPTTGMSIAGATLVVTFLALGKKRCKTLRHAEGITLISLKQMGALRLLQMVSNCDTNI